LSSFLDRVRQLTKKRAKVKTWSYFSDYTPLFGDR
jgi:hypothetical protein